jgi:hypothetical protein
MPIPSIPKLPTPSIPKLDPVAVSSVIPKAPCGLDLGLENLKGSVGGLGGLLDDLNSSVNGIADSISSLGNSLKGQLDAVVGDLKGALGDIKLPSLDLNGEVTKLLGSFSSGDSLGILSKIQDIQNSFPDFDISGMLDKLSSGSFNPCTDVPNQKIIDGKVVEDAIPPVAPAADAVKPPDPPTPPTPAEPPVPETLDEFMPQGVPVTTPQDTGVSVTPDPNAISTPWTGTVTTTSGGVTTTQIVQNPQYTALVQNKYLYENNIAGPGGTGIVRSAWNDIRDILREMGYKPFPTSDFYVSGLKDGNTDTKRANFNLFRNEYLLKLDNWQVMSDAAQSLKDELEVLDYNFNDIKSWLGSHTPNASSIYYDSSKTSTNPDVLKFTVAIDNEIKLKNYMYNTIINGCANIDADYEALKTSWRSRE